MANIALHHVIMLIANTIKTTKLFKCYIDDIVFFSETLEITDNLKRRLKCAFEVHILKLFFIEICKNNDGDKAELLDINHLIDKTEKGGFYL